jgi:hypothetical protein
MVLADLPEKIQGLEGCVKGKCVPSDKDSKERKEYTQS